MRKRVTSGFLVLVSTVCSGVSAEEVRPGNFPEGKVYVYNEDEGVAGTMEIYFPKDHDTSEERVPGIIMFHGGAWRGGSRRQFIDLCRYFAGRGLVAATVSYKLAPVNYVGEGSYKRVCVVDARRAIRWYKHHADALGIDPERIIAGGGSAGGHVCLLATTNPGSGDSREFQEGDTSVAAYLLFNPALSKGDAHDPEVDVLCYLTPDFPPAIAFFGSEDRWLEGWNLAYTKMQSLGVQSVEFWHAAGQGHAFFNNQPWKDLTIRASDIFLKKLGFVDGEPTMAVPETGETLIRQP